MGRSSTIQMVPATIINRGMANAIAGSFSTDFDLAVDRQENSTTAKSLDDGLVAPLQRQRNTPFAAGHRGLAWSCAAEIRSQMYALSQRWVLRNLAQRLNAGLSWRGLADSYRHLHNPTQNMKALPKAPSGPRPAATFCKTRSGAAHIIPAERAANCGSMR